MDEITLKECSGFEWDKGNQNKSPDKHQVSQWEYEQIFFNKPLLVYEDTIHSHSERSLYALGRTDRDRKLFVAFTISKELIRVISARTMSKKERNFYEKA